MIYCAKHPHDPLAVANAARFCSPPDHRAWLAVLGVFSTAHGARARAALRASWMRRERRDDEPTETIVPRFVLRGLGVRPELLDEAAAHNDTVFVEAASAMSCKAGPLRKLQLWLSCAVAAWPHARFIGKGDDDVWADLPGVALSVAASLTHLGAGTQLVWGALEAFHWHAHLHRPVGFSQRRVAKHACRLLVRDSGSDTPGASLAVPHDVSYGALYARTRELGLRELRETGAAQGAPLQQHTAAARRNATVLGPFAFAKGPLYLVASELVAQLVASAEVRDVARTHARTQRARMRRSSLSALYPASPVPHLWCAMCPDQVRDEAEAALASAHGYHEEVSLPWEDVFLGSARELAPRTRRTASPASSLCALVGPVHSHCLIPPCLRHATVALSRVATGANLAMVTIGHEAFTDVKRKSAKEHGVAASREAWLAPSTLVWHDLGERGGLTSARSPPRKLPGLIRHVDALARAEHCRLAVSGVVCHVHVACSGASWRRCKQTIDRRNNSCSSQPRTFTLPAALAEETAAPARKRVATQRQRKQAWAVARSEHPTAA